MALDPVQILTVEAAQTGFGSRQNLNPRFSILSPRVARVMHFLRN